MGPTGQKKKNQDNDSFHVRGGKYVTLRMFILPVKVSGLLSKLVLGKERIHVHETVTATEQVRDEACVQALADVAQAHRDEGAHDCDASQRHAHCSELALQGGRVGKEGGAEDLQHHFLVSGGMTGSPAGRSMERYTLLSA